MVKESLPNDEMIDSVDQFELLYESNQPLIYRFMFWRTKDKMLAEDLTSNVFEKAWRTRNGFMGGSAKAWLYKIAHTTLIDYWREKKEIVDADAIYQTVSDATELDETLDRDLAISKLQKALVKLPRDMNQVVRMRFIEGKSARDTAAKLSISEANVRVIQYRALKKLRNYLQ
ncbi:MAG TPA: sigma-70 family RNA polymerase sigma factor [Candidatus Saccharimonadales bacterium]|nr:sigma-70 family RNA polymerase sigma factor [Candidatus Saccharimonadales bacterium]